eukprot:2683831-Rhodomonas_salina.1
MEDALAILSRLCRNIQRKQYCETQPSTIWSVSTATDTKQIPSRLSADMSGNDLMPVALAVGAVAVGAVYWLMSSKADGEGGGSGKAKGKLEIIEGKSRQKESSRRAV